MSSFSPFTNDDVEQILRVVDRLSNVEVQLEFGDLKLHVRKSSAAEPASESRAQIARSQPKLEEPRAPAPQSAASLSRSRGVEQLPPGAVAIRAPMLGIFYRAPSPTEPPFVKIGQKVRAADPVCLIEVMKLFNTVNAGVDGTIETIEVESGTMVEYDALLFVVRCD
ncbi:MAG: acetyl-CoA carboxylase biotin carboxyl carrier protein subunit [Candidatus Binataceae bacterium]|nr:acetyl-CoA carboxylase biotin carboxyl carrier protein subunit [Candidatus Binataceae bacterium]